MMRLIWRIQFVAAGLAFTLLAGPARAADSKVTPAAQTEAAAPTQAEAAPAQAAAPAEPAPAAEKLPPGTPTPAPAAESPQPGNEPAPVEDSHGVLCAPGFHPLAPLLQFHPLAPVRERFAEQHTAPRLFPTYYGQPRYSLLSGVHPAAEYAEVPGQIPPQSGEQPAPELAGPAGPDAGAPVDGSAEPLPAEAECGVASPTGWYGGADYLLVRPHQTYDSAYQIIPNGASGSGIQNVNFNPSFSSAVHVFAGYETACDESLRFGYTYMFNDAIRSAAVPTGASILSPLGATLFPGDSIVATDHLLLNAWDIADVRKLNFPWCRSDCNCKDCPHWDINWSWGVRLIQLDESILNSASGPDAGVFTQRSAFVGVGPRLGIDVRRQIAHSHVSAYVAADAALLIGELRTIGTNTPTGSEGVQAVPNFDVQLGLSWQPTCHLCVTSGYLFELFGDATQLSEASSLALVAPPQASTVSYDGFFFRGQFSY